ncbi:MAG: hypothetical protein NTW79_00090 [Candidatus Berkelbacteria bacterium]|nr:hypothetical protein [Candidatus Berkelbacteria bacterium]
MKEVEYYKTKISKIVGSDAREVRSGAEVIFRAIKSKTKRIPYVRSKYFKGEKVFLTIFWHHIFEKHERERTKRLKLFGCGIDLLKNSTFDPISRENFKSKSEILHRFYGVLKTGEKFVVQVKENKRSKRKDLISIFPE